VVVVVVVVEKRWWRGGIVGVRGSEVRGAFLRGREEALRQCSSSVGLARARRSVVNGGVGGSAVPGVGKRRGGVPVLGCSMLWRSTWAIAGATPPPPLPVCFPVLASSPASPSTQQQLGLNPSPPVQDTSQSTSHTQKGEGHASRRFEGRGSLQGQA